jgi:hypothetical protein
MAIKNTQCGFTTKRAEWCRRVLTHASEASAGRKANRGFTLLIAIIFMSVMLSFGLALGSLAYKQQVLASGAIESQYAFYVADAGLECALYADQQQNFFAYQPSPASAPSLSCGGATTASGYPLPPSRTASQWIITTRLSYDGGA